MKKSPPPAGGAVAHKARSPPDAETRPPRLFRVKASFHPKAVSKASGCVKHCRPDRPLVGKGALTLSPRSVFTAHTANRRTRPELHPPLPPCGLSQTWRIVISALPPVYWFKATVHIWPVPKVAVEEDDRCLREHLLSAVKRHLSTDSWHVHHFCTSILGQAAGGVEWSHR